MNALEVKGLVKKYESFELKDVTFQVKEKSIMGFIGRNGAGKTTTLKSLLNQIHPEKGEILFFGKEFAQHELEIKKAIAFVSGGVNFYPRKTLKTITDVTKRFYENWDDAAYRKYMELFALKEEKRTDDLSEGMKVKYMLALALSHHARLLILDEPTSGLDPVSRDELLEVFMDLVEKEDVTILFSTHITSDLDKCADFITYIKNGEIQACTSVREFTANYKQVKGLSERMPAGMKEALIGFKEHSGEFNATVFTKDVQKEWHEIPEISIADATLEDIMIHFERE